MLDFTSMIGNYEQRKVANYSNDDLVIDTCMVTDSDEPYETAIAHLAYNGGKWIIVEMYSNKAKANEGHKKWIEVMTSEKLPDTLVDVSTAGVAELCDFCGDEWRGSKKED